MIALIEQEVERAMDGRSRTEKSAGTAISNSRFEPAKVFLALAIRLAIAAWLDTKALAISPTLKPHRILRMSATWAASES